MAWVALIPFGVALLAENLNTPNRKWGVFYFGVCLFGQYWVNSLVGLFMKLKIQVNFTEDFPYPAKKMKKVLPILWLFGAVTGLILVPISLFNPWIALCGYGLFVISQANPITSFGKLIPRLLKRV
jgi:H+/Cl- antiporter ClcA